MSNLILSSFYYRESGWTLKNLSPLELTTLLVGRNATGKTRTIRALQNVTSFMQAKTTLWSTKSFSSEMRFSNPNDPHWQMVYSFNVKEGFIEKEKMFVNGEVIIKREGGVSRYRGGVINPPKDKLVAQIRRDTTTYPEIEQLMSWSEGVIVVSCSDIIPYTVPIPSVAKGFIYPVPFSTIVDALTRAEKKQVIQEAKQLDYHVTEMDSLDVGRELKLVSIRERYIRNDLIDMELSSGMLRVLYLLCFLKFIKHDNRLSLLLIDDLGEGLDYSRATTLGKMVFESCELDGLQLVAGSNDSFLMEVVDLSKWQVLLRKNSQVIAINPSNSHNLFQQFRLTGLSNFDFFSSDVIDNFMKSRS